MILNSSAGICLSIISFLYDGVFFLSVTSSSHKNSWKLLLLPQDSITMASSMWLLSNVISYKAFENYKQHNCMHVQLHLQFCRVKLSSKVRHIQATKLWHPSLSTYMCASVSMYSWHTQIKRNKNPTTKPFLLSVCVFEPINQSLFVNMIAYSPFLSSNWIL